MLFGERRHLDGIVRDEGRLYEGAFAEFAENLVNEFSFAHRVVDFHFQFQTDLPDLLFAFSVQVVTGFFLDGFEDGEAAVGSLEADGLSVDGAFGAAVHRDADAFQQFLGEIHHPVVVLVLHVQFHAGEFRIVVAVHSFVAEVLAHFVYTFETAHDETFQVELGGDAQVEVNVQRIVVCDERTGAGSARDGLQDGSLHFRISGLVKDGAQGPDHDGAFLERLLHARIDNQVNVTLAVAEFGIFERVVGHPVFFLYHGQRFQAFGQHRQFAGVYGDLSCLCAEHISFYSDEVSQIEELFEYRVIQFLVLFGTDVIAGDVNLDASFGVAQFGEAGFAHDAAAHYASGDADLTRGAFGFVLKFVFDVSGIGVYGIFGRGVRVDT